MTVRKKQAAKVKKKSEDGQAPVATKPKNARRYPKKEPGMPGGARVIHHIKGPVFKRICSVAGHRCTERSIPDVLRKAFHNYTRELMRIVLRLVDSRNAATITESDVRTAYQMISQGGVM